jgi:hypothetical protein
LPSMHTFFVIIDQPRGLLRMDWDETVCKVYFTLCYLKMPSFH